VGLVQNQIEHAGVATNSMTMQPHITAMVGAPRAMFLRYPAGNQVGEAGKPQQQRTILTAALEAVAAIHTPGTIVELPYRWRRFPVARIQRLIDVLDTEALDQLREIVNRVTTLALRVSGKFV
jgi:D-proline reductase (dithiol) PrdB